MIVHLLGVPMDLGSGRRGVDMGPSALRIAGIGDCLKDLGIKVVDEGDIDIKNVEELRVGDMKARYLKEITRALKLLSKKVEKIAARHGFPLILGGDHSVAIGTISGFASYSKRKRAKLGVLWIDAHGDINTPATSPSGNIHGMPLAAVLGLGPRDLTNIGGAFRKVDPQNVAVVGVRSL
ncbi:MAG: arginase, partial [Bacteroidota bacterium]